MIDPIVGIGVLSMLLVLGLMRQSGYTLVVWAFTAAAYMLYEVEYIVEQDIIFVFTAAIIAAVGFIITEH